MSLAKNGSPHFPEGFTLLRQRLSGALAGGDAGGAGRVIDELLAGQRTLL